MNIVKITYYGHVINYSELNFRKLTVEFITRLNISQIRSYAHLFSEHERFLNDTGNSYNISLFFEVFLLLHAKRNLHLYIYQRFVEQFAKFAQNITRNAKKGS